MNTDRVFLIAVVSIAVLTVGLHVLGAQPALSWMWGVHFYAFFAPWLLYLALVVVLGAVLAITLRPEKTAVVTTEALTKALSGRRSIIFVAACVILLTMAFWFGRTSHTYLGDGNMLVQSVQLERSGFHERQPMTGLLQSWVYRGVKAWFQAPSRTGEVVAQHAVAFGSVVAGLFFLVVTWFLADELTRLRRGNEGEDGLRTTAVLVWLIITGQGYVQLFFGYVENYSFYTAGVALYLWLCLRYLRGAAPLILPALALLHALALHLSAVVLAPSFVVLVAYALWSRNRRKSAVLDLAIASGALIALSFALATVKQGYNIFSTLAQVTGLVATRGDGGYMFSSVHFRDFFNEQLLIGPLGLWLFLPAVVTVAMAKARRHATMIFLAVAALTYLVASWWAGDSNLGYARNWDLLAPAGLVLTTVALGIFLFLGVGHRSVAPALLLALFVSVFHTLPWIATNANSERSLARLKTLPLGYGRTEVLLAGWYRRAGDADMEREWLQKAVRQYPYNNNAQYFMGLYHLRRAKYDSAVDAFFNAATLRPDKALFRHYLVESLRMSDRLAEAIPHIEFLIEREPNSVNRWIIYGWALDAAGRPGDAQNAYARAEPLYRELVDAAPEDYAMNIGYGYLLYQLKRYAASLPYLQKALELNPQSDYAPCYLGRVLDVLARVDEAVPLYKQCLSVNPDYPEREKIETRLQTLNRD